MNALPNMAQLIFIKDNELQRGPRIGAGAFGTVYQVCPARTPTSTRSSIYKRHRARYRAFGSARAATPARARRRT